MPDLNLCYHLCLLYLFEALLYLFEVGVVVSVNLTGKVSSFCFDTES